MERKTPDQVRWRRESVRRRIEWVLENIFFGRQRSMARSLGMSQSLVSRIIHDQQGAGPAFLAALARLPGLNPSWLLDGVGEPLLPVTKGTLPVAVGVLPGLPEHHRELLTGQRHPVAEAFERTSRYWLSVAPACALIGKRELALLPGDLLLIDADNKLWENRLEALLGRICGVILHRDLGPFYELACLVRIASGYGLDLGTSDDLQTTPTSAIAAATDEPGVRIPRRIIPLDELEKRAAERPAKPRSQEKPTGLQCPFAIVGVCVYLARPTIPF